MDNFLKELKELIDEKLIACKVDKNNIEYAIPVPGVDKSTLKITITTSILKVTNNKEYLFTPEFSRTIPLPCGLDVDNTATKLNDGVLYIYIPIIKAKDILIN